MLLVCLSIWKKKVKKFCCSISIEFMDMMTVEINWKKSERMKIAQDTRHQRVKRDAFKCYNKKPTLFCIFILISQAFVPTTTSMIDINEHVWIAERCKKNCYFLFLAKCITIKFYCMLLQFYYNIRYSQKILKLLTYNHELFLNSKRLRQNFLYFFSLLHHHSLLCSALHIQVIKSCLFVNEEEEVEEENNLPTIQYRPQFC
jgi:hypothetical protein